MDDMRAHIREHELKELEHEKLVRMRDDMERLLREAVRRILILENGAHVLPAPVSIAEATSAEKIDDYVAMLYQEDIERQIAEAEMNDEPWWG